MIGREYAMPFVQQSATHAARTRNAVRIEKQSKASERAGDGRHEEQAQPDAAPGAPSGSPPAPVARRELRHHRDHAARRPVGHRVAPRSPARAEPGTGATAYRNPRHPRCRARRTASLGWPKFSPAQRSGAPRCPMSVSAGAQARGARREPRVRRRRTCSCLSRSGPGGRPAGARPGRDGPTMQVTLKVNGSTQTLSLDTRTTLLDALREHLRPDRLEEGLRPRPVRRLHGARQRRRINSCLTLAVDARGRRDHDDRRLRHARQAASDAGRVRQARRLSVRLLHAGADLLGAWAMLAEIKAGSRATSVPT